MSSDLFKKDIYKVFLESKYIIYTYKEILHQMDNTGWYAINLIKLNESFLS